MATLKDIARESGICVSSVSDILNKNDPRYAAATRDRVKAIANRLKYRPDPQARALRGCKSGIIGILQGVGLSSFAAERSLAMADAVRAAGYGVIASDVGWHKEIHGACDQMIDARVEGVLLSSPAGGFPESEIRRFRKAGIAVASMSGVELPDVPQVRADVRSGMRHLAEHLIATGRRKLVFMVMASTPVMDRRLVWPMLERIDGFEDAVLQAGGTMLKPVDGVLEEPVDGANLSGVRGRVVSCPYDPERLLLPCATAEMLMQGILSWRNRPDAVLCSNDDWAIGALAVCWERGFRVPDALAVTGFDGSLLGASASPRLTTVAQPLQEMARMTVDLLLRQIRGKKLSKEDFRVRVPCRVVVRASSGARGKGSGMEPGVQKKTKNSAKAEGTNV